jgi:hypothetical protein
MSFKLKSMRTSLLLVVQTSTRLSRVETLVEIA